jgi:hypothetical protein
MSRSRKKQPIRGITSADSEKSEKQAAHRNERRKVHQSLSTEQPSEVLPLTRELSNVCMMSKDGKVYLGAKVRPRDLRK